MNPALPRLLPALLCWAGLLPHAGAQVAPSDLVRLEVRVASDSDRKDIKGSTADTVTQHKTLQITVSGKPKSPETRTGKWTVYGRGLKDKEITVLGTDDFKIDLGQGVQKVETKQVSTTSTPEHGVVSRGGGGAAGGGGGGGGNKPARVKKVAAEGTKYLGYGVVVKNGDIVVGEAFEPMGLKQEAAK